MSDVFDSGLVPRAFTGVSCLTRVHRAERQSGRVDPPLLLVLCDAEDWRTAQHRGEHHPDSLSDLGFVHLSTPEQVHLPANRLYAGRTDLLLLHVDPARLTAAIRWEPGVATDPESMLFPHLFGALPLDAVTSVTHYRPNVDGMFAEFQPPPAT